MRFWSLLLKLGLKDYDKKNILNQNDKKYKNKYLYESYELYNFYSIYLIKNLSILLKKITN